LALSWYFGKSDSFTGGLFGLGTPAWKASHSSTSFLGNAVALLQSKKTLLTRTEALMKENAALKAEVQDRKILAAENDSLKELFGRKPQKKDFIYAAVLARPGFFTYDSLVLDAGKADGIEAGQMVYAGEYTVIGTISDVYDSSSRVILFSNPPRKHRLLSVSRAQHQAWQSVRAAEILKSNCLELFLLLKVTQCAWLKMTKLFSAVWPQLQLIRLIHFKRFFLLCL
jgi:hypothetical protein